MHFDRETESIVFNGGECNMLWLGLEPFAEDSPDDEHSDGAVFDQVATARKAWLETGIASVAIPGPQITDLLRKASDHHLAPSSTKYLLSSIARLLNEAEEDDVA